jgi:hypothetical protein
VSNYACGPVCEGNTPVRGSGDACRAYECADNADPANSGMTEYNADHTLALPSGVCIESGDCHDVSGHGYENSADNVCSCIPPRTWSNYADIPTGE